jgi:hypothetical protein
MPAAPDLSVSVYEEIVGSPVVEIFGINSQGGQSFGDLGQLIADPASQNFAVHGMRDVGPPIE